jgi:hypothetical protein
MPSVPAPLRRLASSLPALADIVQLWRDWRTKRRPMVLRPYVDLHSRWRRAAHFLVPAALGLLCLVYGFFFALTAPYLIVPMAAPVAVLGLLSIWALPENDIVPIKPMEIFFSALLIGLVLWPNYLALTLPGLPWITMIRLTAFPMAFFLLVCLSMSPEFRAKIIETGQGVPLMLRFMLLYALNACITLPLSHNIGASINGLLLQWTNWIGAFLVSLYLFRVPGRVERYAGLLLLLAVPVAVVAAIEFQEQHVLWAGHIPSFLRVEDDSAQLALASAVRGATGQYRAKSAFSTPLGLAEFMALLTPFALHWAVGRYPLAQRLFGLVMIPVIYIVVRMTDARLGVLGYLISILTYVLFWSLIRWRQRINDLIAATMVYAYPAAFLAVMAASMFVHKIHVIIFGGGAQAGSNDHRQEQFQMALPALLKNPIGHGTNQSGAAMGYGAGEFIAIDSYYICVALDYGVLGLIFYVGMFVIMISAAVRTMLRFGREQDRELMMLIPLTACLSAFVMIRGVFAQPDIHPMIFAILGMTVALVARARSKEPSPERKQPARSRLRNLVQPAPGRVPATASVASPQHQDRS